MTNQADMSTFMQPKPAKQLSILTETKMKLRQDINHVKRDLKELPSLDDLSQFHRLLTIANGVSFYANVVRVVASNIEWTDNNRKLSEDTTVKMGSIILGLMEVYMSMVPFAAKKQEEARKAQLKAMAQMEAMGMPVGEGDEEGAEAGPAGAPPQRMFG